MKDYDLFLYYIEKYQKERDNLNIQEILDYQNEIMNLFNDMNIEQYKQNTQEIFKDFLNTFQTMVKEDISFIENKVKHNQELKENYIQKQEINYEKGEQQKEKEEEILESMPFGLGLLGPLQKAINKF